MKKILFICHDGSRTGAPIFLLNFLSWFKENTNIPFLILLRQGGELETEFASLAPTFVFYPPPQNNSIPQKINKILKLPFLLVGLKLWTQNNNIGLIYSNTITNGDLLSHLSFLNCPIISHIHELEMMINLYPKSNYESTKKLTDYYIACSHAVQQNLIINHHISENFITVIHEAILAQKLTQENRKISKQNIRKELEISPQAIIIGGCGTIDYRKGTDLFIELALTISKIKLSKEIHFVWLGGDIEGKEFVKLQDKIKQDNFKQFIHFVGKKTNPLDYFVTFDIFTLTSREDPYPLVCLEVATVGKPIICFDDAGGIKEFVEDDCGFVVPYGDVNAMAKQILTLIEDTQLYKQMSERVKQKVIERHDLEITAKQIVDIINDYYI